MKNQSCQIGAGAYRRVGSFDAGYAADFDKKSHGAGLMNARSLEIKARREAFKHYNFARTIQGLSKVSQEYTKWIRPPYPFRSPQRANCLGSPVDRRKPSSTATSRCALRPRPAKECKPPM